MFGGRTIKNYDPGGGVTPVRRQKTPRVDFYIGFVLSRAFLARVPISVALFFAPRRPPRQEERALNPKYHPGVQ